MIRLLTRTSYVIVLHCAFQPSIFSLNLNRRPNFSCLQKDADVKGLLQTAIELGTSPPWNAPSWIWALAWKIHAAVLPFLHAFDKCHAEDSFVNLYPISPNL